MRNHWLRKQMKLQIRRIKPEPIIGSFIFNDIEIVKGPKRTTFSSCVIHDLRESCGVTPPVEMARLLTEELEKTYIGSCHYPGKDVFCSSMRFHKDLELTRDERIRLLTLLHKLWKKEPIDSLLD